MLKLAIAGALALGLAGCQTVNPTVATPRQVYVGLNTYGIAVNAVNVYLRSPACRVSPPAALCQKVLDALRSAKIARLQITAAAKTNAATPLTALNALQAAYSVIQAIPQN